MIVQREVIWEEGGYSYSRAGSFVPFLMHYRHEEGGPRPALIIVPGGGYHFVSPREGELVARRFYNLGFQTFVLTYTVNPLGDAPLGMQPLKDLARAVRLIRKNARALGTYPDKMAICGFSAGGHLCADLCVHWKDVPESRADLADVSCRPDAALLCYPVITAGKYSHLSSIENRVGRGAPQAEFDHLSLENHVSASTPPCFIWQTDEDGAVPVENSYLFAAALRRAGRPYALHVFSKGHHGISTADREWARARTEGVDDGSYTMEQFHALQRAIESGTVLLTENEKKAALKTLDDHHWLHQEQPWPEVSIWPDMAARWLGVIMNDQTVLTNN